MGDARAVACALRTVRQLGFGVTNVDEQARSFTADQQTPLAFHRALIGNTDRARLTVAVSNDPETRQQLLSVTASTISARSNLFSRNVPDRTPGRGAQIAANAVLSACSDGPLMLRDHWTTGGWPY